MRISVSRAKCDTKADLQVRSTVARQKSCFFGEMRNCRSEISLRNFLGAEKGNVGHHLKRVSNFHDFALIGSSLVHSLRIPFFRMVTVDK